MNFVACGAFSSPACGGSAEPRKGEAMGVGFALSYKHTPSVVPVALRPVRHLPRASAGEEKGAR